ncbi:MAG: TonB-dependent receptor plug domain-containing protein [Gallionella sp.]|nr:TonB-dependent receptor plug domain-containing protein [Gallionella sp.]MDD4958250.1 TonB-dependent receptor plug domain-containing protein [Gallionella sp.]
MKAKRIVMCVALAFVPSVYAVETLPEVVVTAEKIQPLPVAAKVAVNPSMRAGSSDTAKLLENQAGVSLATGGGVSSLPVIHGMADDRVKVKVDGMDLVSACANHMNSPLSYIDPAQVSSVNVMAGITPVSMGGDSIGGSIVVNSHAPEFAKAGQGSMVKGQAAVFYRSNGNALGGNVSATAAGESVSLNYTGSTVRAGNYKAARDFKAAGLSVGTKAWLGANEVGSSMYQAENHSFGLAMRNDNHLLEIKLGLQRIPYQGFPNVRMDMTGNDSQQVNVRYKGNFAWGGLEARVYNEATQHQMNFLVDKLPTTGMMANPAGMPMATNGQNTGVSVKADMALSERDLVRFGAEIQRYRMKDWWDPTGPVVGMMAMTNMMSGGTFLNINNGQRDRVDVFGEWDARWNEQWLSQLGLRLGQVSMNAGNVQGYNTIAYPAATYAAFNALNRQRTDNNVDLTALARYTPDAGKTFEAGYAMKTRSPNLYERFAWSKNNNMAMTMNSWFGDGNGYVGDVNLKPEVAHTLSATADWHDAGRESWAVKATPYYTRVQNYIDASICTVAMGCPVPAVGFANLQLVNQTAEITGLDVSGHLALAKDSAYGSFDMAGVLNYTSGKNLTTGGNLYHIMPLNAHVTLTQQSGNWTNALEAQFVSAKTNVQAVRNELKTGGYSLFNLRSSYDWQQLRLDVGVENLFNKFYAHPLSGVYIGQRTMVNGTAVPGMGRSIYTSLTVKF